MCRVNAGCALVVVLDVQIGLGSRAGVEPASSSVSGITTHIRPGTGQHACGPQRALPLSYRDHDGENGYPREGVEPSCPVFRDR